MPSVTVQSRVTAELKQEAETVFANMGMSLADGIRIFLQQTVNMQGLPFKPKAKQPNVETIEAMNDAMNGRVNRHTSIDAIFDGLDNK